MYTCTLPFPIILALFFYFHTKFTLPMSVCVKYYTSHLPILYSKLFSIQIKTKFLNNT